MRQERKIESKKRRYQEYKEETQRVNVRSGAGLLLEKVEYQVIEKKKYIIEHIFEHFELIIDLSRNVHLSIDLPVYR